MTKKILLVLLATTLFVSAEAQRNRKPAAAAPAPAPAAPAATDYNALFKPVKWRSIGPFRGGRSVTATGVVGDITTYYKGTT